MRHVLGGLAALLLCHSADAEPQVTILVDQFAFVPATLTVTPGTTVIWRNKDETPHNIVASDKQFASPALDTGEEFHVTFDKPGSFAYFCRLHPHMTGSITVTAGSSAPTK
jgi:plastocyanin